MNENKQRERFMSNPEVQHVSGKLSRSTLWRLIKAGLFPAPILISKNRKAWLESEVQAWIQKQVAASRNQAK